MKENNQCYLAAAEVFSWLREGVSIDSPRALARSLPPPPPPPRPPPPPPHPHSSASFTGWSRGVPHNGIINTQAPGAAPLSRCSGPTAAANAGSCSPSTPARLPAHQNGIRLPRWSVGAAPGPRVRPASGLDHLLGSSARFKPVPIKRTGYFKLFLVFSSFSLQKPYICLVVLF